jgi:Protein of unknown function (DUF2889)
MLYFRRCIRITTRTTGARQLVCAALEDDFHHFRVELDVTDGRISRVQATAPRHPYSLCATASEPLKLLEGMAVEPSAHAVMRQVEAREQCTHMLDLAGLACAAAARGLAERRYDIEVPMRVEGRTQARLWRDGALLLDWQVQDLTVLGPAPYTDLNLRHGMARWALTNLPEDEAEAALVLRRGTAISLGKGHPLDAQVHARATGACYVQQPERAVLALRQVGSTWDFSERREQLCVDDAAWLAFESAACPPTI